MKLAIMQPYIFPYVGYFQMIKAVDTFIFYDDVNFIKKGWINRNRILLNGSPHFFTIPCIKLSQNKLINEVAFDRNQKDFQKVFKTIELAYRKAPFFEQVYPLIVSILSFETESISSLAEHSVIKTSKYLGLKTKFKTSSQYHPRIGEQDKADRLIEICHSEKAAVYINAEGGMELYKKEYFAEQGIELKFLKPSNIEYPQFNNGFTPWLSIIDLMMFNSIESLSEKLNQYRLV